MLSNSNHTNSSNNYFIDLYHQMSEEQFSVAQFRDAFEVFQKIKNKLQPFMAQYKAHNMSWIIGSLEELHRLLYDDKIEVTLKFHSLFGIKLLFDIGDPFIINLIEVYFLPKILQIALYEADKPHDKRGSGYFAHIGFPKQTPDLVKMSFTWVKLASEFVGAASQVKPRTMFEVQELKEPSNYALAFKKLQSKGFKRYTTPAYYKEGVAETVKQNYQQNLEILGKQLDDNNGGNRFSEYYIRIYRQFIENDRPYQGRLNPQKLLQECDSFVTSSLITLIVQEFQHPSLNRRKNCLILLNEMIKWGDIETAHLLNCTDFIDETAEEIGSSSIDSKKLNRSKVVFHNKEGNDEMKKEYYNQILKSITFWALCYPKGLKKKGRESKIKHLHDELRTKLELEFPDDRELKEKKRMFDQAAERQAQRNIFLLRQLEEEDPQFRSFIQPLKSQPVESKKPLPLQSKHPLPVESKPPPTESKAPSKKNLQSNSLITDPTPVGDTPGMGTDYEIWKKQISDVNGFIDTLIESENRVQKKIVRINSFRIRYEKDLESADLANEQFDDIFMKSETLIEKIDKIQNHIDKYTDKKTTFEQFVEAMTGKKVAASTIKKEEKPASPQKKSEVKIEAPKQKKNQVKLKQQSDELPKIQNQILASKEEDSIKSGKGNIVGTSLLGNNNRVSVRQQKKVVVVNKMSEQIDQMTPIKKGKQDIEKFDSKDMSILPEISRQSGEKQSLNLSIQPASHVDNYIHKESSKKIGESSKNIGSRMTEKSKQEVRKQELRIQEQKRQDKELLEKLDQLEEQVEPGVGAQIPKSLKNITGSYKISQQIKQHMQEDKEPSIIEQNQMIQSRKSQKIKFQESMGSLLERVQEDQDDIIMMPDANPLEQSFHELRVEDKTSIKTKELSFKKCFQQDKYLFGNDRFSKKFKLTNDTFNLIKRDSSSGKKSRAKQSSISIPSMLDERNKKYEEEIRYIQDKKNRKIVELESKIKVLQTTGDVMKEKLVKQDHQIKTIKAYSEIDGSVKKTSILEDHDIVFKRLASAQNKSIKEKSFYGDVSRGDPKYLDPMGTLINSRRFSNFFEQFKSQKQKRLLIKNKELLLKNNQVEFGCMSKKQKDYLIVTFYITPAMDLDGLVSRVILKDENLDVEIEPKNIPSIRKGKQEKVIVTVNIVSAPYYLPEIEFTYNLENKLDSQRFLIPCAFHKFVHLMPVGEAEVERQFQNKKSVKRGQQVPYSRKLLKNMNMLTDYFSGGILLNNGDPNDKGEIQFAGRAVWRREQFFIRLMIRPSQFLYIQLLSDSQNSIAEFYSSMVTNLLMKNIDLKQM